jgi:hypothetical protein
MALTPTANQLAILQLNQAMLGQAAGTTVMAAGLPTFTTANAYAKVLFDANSAWNSLDATQAYTKLLTNLSAGTAATAADINALVAAVVAETGSTKMLKTIPEGLALLTVAFYNFATSTTTNVWTDAAKKLVNQVAVDSYYTLDMGNAAASTVASSTVTADVATVAAAEALITSGGVAVPTTYTLTDAADIIPGTAANDTIVATGATLTAGDAINGAAGTNTMNLSTNGAANLAAFTMQNVQNVNVTADGGVNTTIDFSGTTGIGTLTDTNSTGSVAFNWLTNLVTGQMLNVTGAATNGTFMYRDAVLAGAESMTVVLNNMQVANGQLTIGNETTGNAGLESLTLAVTGNSSSIATLNSQISKLTVTGSDTTARNLTVTNDLLNTLGTVDASGFNGTLTLNMRTAGTKGISYTGSTGSDVISFLGNNNNQTVSTGTGNDSVTIGNGIDSVDLGAGTDTLVYTTTGNATPLTVSDTVVGGAGVDTIRFDGTSGANISRSEAQRMSSVEVITFNETAGTTAMPSNTLVVTDNLVNTAEGNSFTVNNTSALATTVNLSELTVPTNIITFNGSATAVDTVIAKDQQINSGSKLYFGAGAGDTLVVMDGANITQDDLSNVTGLDRIELRATSNTAQAWTLNLPSTVAAGSVIYLDNDLPQGSTLTISSATAVTVLTNANVVVTNLTPLTTTVLNSLEYTLTTDNMTGTAVSDNFLAETLSQVQLADYANGNSGAVNDTLQLNFSVNNTTATLWNQLNNTQLVDINTINFCQVNSVNGTAANIVAPVIFQTTGMLAGTALTNVNTGSGADSITAQASAVTFNLGDGTNSYIANAVFADNVTTGQNSDSFSFDFTGTGAYVNAAKAGVATAAATLVTGDTITAGQNKLDSTGAAAVDTLNLTDGLSTGVNTGLYNLGNATGAGGLATISGIDTVNYTTVLVTDGLVVNNAALAQQYGTASANNMTFNIVDATALANTSTLFDASSVVTGNSVTVTVNGSAVANLGYATHVADVLGGAGNDTITIGNTAALGNKANYAAASSYVVQGNAGSDNINITNGNLYGVGVRFDAPNDGGTQGASGINVVNGGTNLYDTITGYNAVADATYARDAILFNINTFGATTASKTAGAVASGTTAFVAGDALSIRTDGAINLTGAADNLGYKGASALRMTQSNTGFTDANLYDLTAVAARANVIGVQSAATNGMIVIANGQSQSAIYMFVEDGQNLNNVSVGELKILGVFDVNNVGAASASGAVTASNELFYV